MTRDCHGVEQSWFDSEQAAAAATRMLRRLPQGQARTAAAGLPSLGRGQPEPDSECPAAAFKLARARARRAGGPSLMIMSHHHHHDDDDRIGRKTGVRRLGPGRRAGGGRGGAAAAGPGAGGYH